jgi:hypothetical protein
VTLARESGTMEKECWPVCGPPTYVSVMSLGSQKKDRCEERLNRPALKSVLLIGIFFLASAGCSTTNAVLRQPPSPVEISTVVVYPVELLLEEPDPFSELALAQRVIDACIQSHGHQLAFFGPTEFEIKRREERNAWVASNAVPLLVQNLQDPKKSVVLRTRLEKRKTSQMHEIRDAKGRSAGMASGEVIEWIGQVEIVHPSSGTVIFEASDKILVDAFAQVGVEGIDKDSQRNELILKLVALAFKEVDSFLSAPKTNAMKLEYAVTPSSFPGAKISSDALTAELDAQDRAKLLAPSATEKQLAQIANDKSGTVILLAAEKSNLRALDLIESIEGEGFLPQILARKRLRGPVQVVVRREGRTMPVTIP